MRKNVHKNKEKINTHKINSQLRQTNKRIHTNTLRHTGKGT